MKKSTLFATLLAAAMAMPTFAQEEPVVINGSIINWYYYGKDIHTNDIGWQQQSDVLGYPSNFGLISLAVDPSDKRKAWVCGFPIRDRILYGNAGAVYTGDAYYTFFMSETGWEDNMESEYGSETYTVTVRKWTWDGVDENGEYTNVKNEKVATMRTHQPIDLTYDPDEDVVYGIFYDGNTYKIGTLDMETFKVTNISREGLLYGAPQCIAVNSKGELYAIDASGNVYTVSKTDGKLTTIGNVGFESQPRRMSATFDLRTDKLYWIGFMNNGKISAATDGTNNTLSVADGGRDTGIYEVDTTTGEAKLIKKTDWVDSEPIYDEYGEIVDYQTNKYGKMQLTGIYVEGSIMKYAKDLKVSIDSYPQQLKEGATGEVTVKVKNVGTSNINGRNYSVSLYADGELIGTIDNYGDDIWTENLKVGESSTLPFSYTAPDRAGEHTLEAVVTYDADEHVSNNTAQATVLVMETSVKQHLTLTKDTEGENAIKISWNAIDGQIVEGAEDYVPFSYDGLRDWIMYDGDKGYTQKANNWNASIEYPNSSTPKAFIVMNPEKAGFDLAVSGERFNAHSGNQYFAAWFTAVPDDSEEGGHQVPNDDWMISPRLDGKAQTITFWAKGYKGTEATGYITEMDHPELMRILATEAEYTSVEDMDLADWTVVKDTFLVDNTAWTEYTADLPNGTKHFALQCCSQEGFVLMIDDISFRIKAAASYNVYRNNDVVRNTTTLSYTMRSGAVKGDRFWVTAVDEDENEFLTSNIVVFNAGESEIAEDVDGNNTVDENDIAAVIAAITSGETGKADVNGDGKVDIADILAIINKMKK